LLNRGEFLHQPAIWQIALHRIISADLLKQLDKHLPSKPMPDSTREMRWLAEHQREYVGQWVALDGDRLIAVSPNHEEVAAAAEADGAYLPLFTYIDDPDKVYAGF
jgi:hypothetical protein